MEVAIDKIKIGSRIRKELKGIPELAENIKQVGLIHPISVDSGFNLLCGMRRLEACKLLSLDEIECKIFPLDIEADENLFRQDFTPEEKVKGLERIEERERERAKERREATQFGGVGNISLTDIGQTRDIVAKKVGWSGRTYEKAKSVIKSGDQKLIDMMNRESNVTKATIPNRIATNHRIAELRTARVPHRCVECVYSIPPKASYYSVTLAGSGLGSIKFPDSVCVHCIEKHLGR